MIVQPPGTIRFLRSCEHATEHAPGHISREAGTIEGTRCQIGCLTELIAAREGNSICDCEDQRNNCTEY